MKMQIYIIQFDMRLQPNVEGSNHVWKTRASGSTSLSGLWENI